MSYGETLSILQALECELHEPKARGDAERLGQLLHSEFREHGRSGSSYTRATIFAQLLAETQPVKVHAQDFRLMMLADGVFLLMYRSAHVGPSGLLERHTNRASVWRLESAGWQMVFHQGTPTDDFSEDAL